MVFQIISNPITMLSIDDKSCARMDYLPPWAEAILYSPETVVCESPVGGGNEGIGFEDWN